MKNNELKFNFAEESATSSKGQISFTAVLNNTAKARATEAMQQAASNPDLFDLANAVIDNCEASQLFEFMEKTVGHNIETDINVLDGATEDELSRMLESRRSDRSKLKAKNPRSSAATCISYLAAGYAEMLIRKVWNKPYSEVSNEITVDTADLDAVNRKIKSLQSKKSRLSALVNAGAVEREAELDEVKAEIDRLSSFRGTPSRSTGKTVIKDSVDVATIRAALSKVDTSGMSEAEQNQLAELMKKLG